MEERVYMDPKVLEARVDASLDMMDRFLRDERVAVHLGERFVQMLASWRTYILDRRDEPFTIAVCGEFKRGKSTLINALLGEAVAPVDVMPETCTINRICYGEEAANEAWLSGGRRMLLSDDELCRERLEALARQNGEPFRSIVIRRPLDILRAVTIVDTPGLNDNDDFAEMTARVLGRSDAVIYVFSADAPLSMKEQMFLRTLVLPHTGLHLFMVSNRMDMIRPRDYQRYMAMVQSRLNGVLCDASVWPVSALDECCRLWGEERPAPDGAEQLEAWFDAFRGRIENLIRLRRDVIIADRNEQMISAMLGELRAYLDDMYGAVTSDLEEVEARLRQEEAARRRRGEENAAALAELRQRAEDCKHQAQDWVGQLIDRMEAEIPRVSGASAEDIKKYYSFYCTDLLEEALQRCVQHHMIELTGQIDRLTEGARPSETLRGFSAVALPDLGEKVDFAFALDNRSWTKGDTVGWVGSAFFGSSLLGLAIDGVAGAMRGKAISSQGSELSQAITAQYASLRQCAAEILASAYDRMAGGLVERVNEAFQSWNETDAVRLSRMRELLEAKDAQKREIARTIDVMRGELAGIEALE